MSNQKRIGLEGTIKAYAGCSRIIATIQRASSTELPADKTPAGCPKGQAVLCVQTAKKTPIFIDSKPTSENREGCRMTYAIIWAEWEGHADASIRPHAA